MMGEHRLDALVTAFTGQLSGWYFLPSFNRLSDGFYTDPAMGAAEELFIRALARTMKPHANVIGFDFGNETQHLLEGPLASGRCVDEEDVRADERGAARGGST